MNYTAIGDTWDGTGFIDPQPYTSWTLDENDVWQPPEPYPDDNNRTLHHYWNEPTTSWVEITE